MQGKRESAGHAGGREWEEGRSDGVEGEKKKKREEEHLKEDSCLGGRRRAGEECREPRIAAGL